MTRFPDWPTRLATFIAERRNQEFVWGSRDCVALAADWIEVATGERVFHGKHTTQRTAQAEVIERGGMRHAVTDVLGPELDHPRRAQRGDVVMYEGIFGDTLGVCAGAQFWAQGADGLVAEPMSAVVAAWRI